MIPAYIERDSLAKEFDFIPKLDKNLLLKFLAAKTKDSMGTAKNKKYHLKSFYEIVNLSIVDMKNKDILRFLREIDMMDISKASKNNYKFSVSSFLKFAKWELMDEYEIHLEMPPKSVFAFSEKKKTRVSVEDLGLDSIMPISQINEILKLTRMHSLRDHVFFLLLKYTGARNSEIASTRLENLNVHERYFISGVVNGAKKSDVVIYFYPEKVARELKIYLMTVDQTQPWLFPGYKDYWTGIYQVILKYEKVLGYNFHTHQFRHAIITRRYDMGIKPHESEKLMNHIPSTVEYKSYIRKNYRELRKLADKYNPYD